MLLPHVLNGEKVFSPCLLELLLALEDIPDRSEEHISPQAGTSPQVLKSSFADAVLVGNRYFLLLPCDTAALLTATSAPQPLDSRLTGSIFPQSSQQGGQPVLTTVLLFSQEHIAKHQCSSTSELRVKRAAMPRSTEQFLLGPNPLSL